MAEATRVLAASGQGNSSLDRGGEVALVFRLWKLESFSRHLESWLLSLDSWPKEVWHLDSLPSCLEF